MDTLVDLHGRWEYLNQHEDVRGRHADNLRSKYGDVPITLELGPGRIDHIRPHATLGLNKSADPNCDIYWNLENGIPLPDGFCAEIWSNNVLEHIHRDRFIYFMNDLYRVLEPGGYTHHVVPYYKSPHSVSDPTHHMRFSEFSFQYYCMREGKPFVERFSDYGITARFRRMRQKIITDGLELKVEMWK